MSAEARMQGLIEDAVRAAVKPLEDAVEALGARLAAVEGSSGPAGAAPAKRAAGGRTAKAKAQPAESTATADDGTSAQPSDSDSGTGDASERVPEQRRGESK
jgi:hypothetical protein